MFGQNSDKAWQYFGKTDPYFGVLTHDKFRAKSLTQSARTQFFQSGKNYLDTVVDGIREHLDASFRPARALDFGCGVGRLTIPFAAVCESVTGVDVSDAMLAEAVKNSHREGVSNVTFTKSDDHLSNLVGPFDFVHSFIVFQHIRPERGERLLKALIHLLRDDGIGVLHFTTSWSSDTPLARRLLADAYGAIPLLHRVRNVLRGRPVGEPLMQMNRYDLNRLLRILHETGCHRVHLRFTETAHYGHPFYGVILFFQKHRLDVGAHA